jgi:hypothetical protein
LLRVDAAEVSRAQPVLKGECPERIRERAPIGGRATWRTPTTWIGEESAHAEPCRRGARCPLEWNCSVTMPGPMHAVCHGLWAECRWFLRVDSQIPGGGFALVLGNEKEAVPFGASWGFRRNGAWARALHLGTFAATTPPNLFNLSTAPSAYQPPSHLHPPLHSETP